MEGRRLWTQFCDDGMIPVGRRNHNLIMMHTADCDHSTNYLRSKLISMRSKLNSINESSVQSIMELLKEVIQITLNRERSVIGAKAMMSAPLFTQNLEIYVEHFVNDKMKCFEQKELPHNFFCSSEYDMMKNDVISYAAGLNIHYIGTQERIDEYLEEWRLHLPNRAL